MSYLDEIDRITEREKEEIKKQNDRIIVKIQEFTKKYFEIGNKVEFKKRNGKCEGIVIGIDDSLNVAIMVNKINEESVKNSIAVCRADEIEISNK